MAAAEHTPEDEEHIFQQAAALPLPERIAYLDFACEGQPTLRADVERLIAGSQDPEFMERAVDRSATMQIHNVARFQPEEVGERIGPYTLLQRIGEGGFGVVWMAGQEEPVRRRVALKIIKLGMDTKEVVARFEQERQALAMMDHPNIARVIDAAATPLGRPYFAMELVSGVKITEYCDQANLPTVDRLRLFMSVCHAVQHAHQKGIIHRDLKPSNILVTLHDGVPVPKVIDFGVAKATQQRLTDLTLFTQFEQMIGTPLYMSPEQAEMSSVDIDTRSDIYSLGVLLYELLTGRTPFDPEHLVKAGFDEMRRVIREVVPEKPSTFVSTMALDVRAAVARHRSAEEAKFIGLIRGDLDWIVMKALEKDRNRRYDTAGALAKDIERHLRSEPVLARPASAGYRFRTFVRRNRAAFAATSGIAAAVLVGFAVSLWQALRAQREADRANSALADLRGSAPAFADQARGLVGRERFDEAIEKLDYALKLQPDSVEYLLTKADLLESQMRFSEAMPLYREAIRRGPVARRVTEHVQLCERMEREKAMRGKLSRESLAELFAKMDEEHRSAAELMQVGQLLGAERTLLLDYWMERLQALPIGPDKPLESRLKMRADGLLSLDLSGTRVEDLDALQGMPLGDLDCTGCEHLTDITSLREMHLRQLRLANTGVSDLVALSSVSQLEELDISGTKVTSLQPLLGIGIRSLKLAKVEVEDLSPLGRMPLEELEIEQTRVSDLSPLEKLPLKRLSADSIPAIDFRPISELPLEYCSIRRTRCYDLAFLQKMPLRELYLTGCFARNSLALAGIKTLEILALPELMRGHPEEGMTTLRKHARLRRIGFEAPEGPQPGLLPTAEEFWKTWDPVVERFREAGVKIEIKVLADQTWEASLDNQNVEDLSPLRGSPITKLYLRNTKITSLNAIAGMPLRALSVQGTKVSDLAPLSGMLLEELELNDTAVASLNPLRGMRIRSLGIEQTEIRDLSALRGMPLEALWMGTTKVSDLSPLRGLPIRILHIDDCPFLSDLSPLLDIPTLEQVFLPTTAANVQVLRSLTHLQFISFDLNSQANRPLHTAEEFWSMKTPMKEEQLARGQHFDELRFLIRSRVEHHRSPELWKDYLKLVTLAMALGDLHDYDELCSKIQRRPPGIDSGLILRAGCWHTTCGISTDAMREAFNDLKAGYGDPPKTGESGRIVYALCEYRLGLWEQASNRLLQAPPCTRAYTSAITATLLALAHTKMGDLQAGRLKLEEARVHSEEGWPTDKPATDVSKGVGSWYECLLAHLLFKEAEALIATAPGGAGQK